LRRQGRGYQLDLHLTCCAGPWLSATGIEENKPRPPRALDDGFHALPVVPAGDARLIVGRGGARRVGIDAAAQALGGAGEHAIPARGARSNHDGGRRRAGQRLDGDDVRRIARGREIWSDNSRNRAEAQPAI